MPHLVLEYSANIAGPADFSRLFDRLHEILATTAGIRRDNCKSRARVADVFHVASGAGSGAFVHLDIRFLEGRSSKVKSAVAEQTLELLMNWYREAAQQLDLQITVEIRDIEQASYFKYPAGTLTPQ